jgi:hypothetical protein
MEKSQALHLLKAALAEITLPDGSAATDRFSSLREVDAKTREVTMVLEGMEGLPPSLLGTGSTVNFRRMSRIAGPKGSQRKANRGSRLDSEHPN